MWYFEQISTSSGMGTNRWKKYKIEQFPIKKADQNEILLIENKVDQIVRLKKENPEIDTSSMEMDLDNTIMEIYGLNQEEKEIIRSS